MEVIAQLLNFITSKEELLECMKDVHCHIAQTFNECVEICVSSNLQFNSSHEFKIDSVIDFLHDELNTGNWKEVPMHVRKAFTAASFLKAIIILQNAPIITASVIQVVLKCIDLGLLLGAPLDCNSELLVNSATYLVKKIKEVQRDTSEEATAAKPNKRQHDDHEPTYNDVNAKEIATEKCPSLQHFNKSYFTPQIPVKLEDCISHWPASTKWLDLNYLLQVAGDRTVPIELGSSYTNENWSQKLMTLRDFIKTYYLEETCDIGYLAQHNLFDQIVELKDDICIPEYCALSREYATSFDPDINAWFGPKGTVSPLHFDPKDNLLAQVYGTKQILLFAPSDSSYVYPHQDQMLFNTAQVDPVKPNLEKYPEFSKASMYKCLLEPGQMLYIPPTWWHHVMAREKSFSVSFWWQ